MEQIQAVKAERILARQVATELTLDEVNQVSGALMAGSGYDTCSGGVPDACDID